MTDKSLSSMDSLIKRKGRHSSRHVTPITKHASYNRRFPTQSETRSLNGKSRTVIHVSIRSSKKSSSSRVKKIKDLTAADLQLTSTNQINKSDITPKSTRQPQRVSSSPQLHDTSSSQQSSSQVKNIELIELKNKKDWYSNTKDLMEYSRRNKERKRPALMMRRCFCILLCLCAALLLGLIISIALIATLIKPNTTTTTTTQVSETATATNSNLTTTTVITTISTITTLTTQSTTGTIATTMSTTTSSVPPTTSVAASATTGSYYGSETLTISCSVTLVNITIQIFVQTTVGATYYGIYNSFSTGVVTGSHSTGVGQIVYAWTITTGQTIACVSATYSVSAQYNLYGTAQINSNDTYIVTTTTNTGVTTTFTGHF